MNEKRAALKTLKTNKANIDTLVSSYGSFANEDVNILGGSKSGSATRDGDNSRIVLDALPSQYDFPAFVTSIEKLVQSQGGVTISALGGTDNSTSSASNAAQPALASATPVELKVPLSVTGDYTKIQAFIKTLESSIRPLYVNNLRLSGSDSSMTLNTDLTTYYQPEARFDVTTKVVK
jgi:Tfp pilus assembly protein PilO